MTLALTLPLTLNLHPRPHPNPQPWCLQVLDLTDVVALLKSSELANTVEVQIKSASYELTIPEDFDAAWNIMEACRRNTQAHKLQASHTKENADAFRTDTYVEVDEELQKACGVDPNPGPDPNPHPHPDPHPDPNCDLHPNPNPNPNPDPDH